MITALSPNFERYYQFAPTVPVYQITDGKRPIIHRFFDSSPISPSSKLIALTEFPFQDRLPEAGDRAAVIVIDLQNGEEIYRTETSAWDTQVGAHVQWGASDSELFFNRMDEEAWTPYGVKVDLTSGNEFAFDGPVYHVSPNGKLAISPDLRKITIAQAGYGVHVPSKAIIPNIGAPVDDGIFVTNTTTGESSLLVSLDEITSAIGREHFNGPGACYSFHTKWNGDGDRIMFILRWFPQGRRKSQNWLVTLRADGTDIKVAVSPKTWADGHHPNWYPRGEKIIMNLPSVDGTWGKLRTIIGKIGRKLNIATGGVPLHFKSVNSDGSNLLSVSQHTGSGHPTVHPSELFLISNSYLNKSPAFKDGSVPLRLIDFASGRLENLIRIDCRPNFPGPKSEYRIDPHPAWHAGGRFLTINGSVNGIRSVFVADFIGYINKEYGNYL